MKKRYASIVRSLLGMVDLEEEPICWHFLNVPFSVKCILNRQYKVTTMWNIGGGRGGLLTTSFLRHHKIGYTMIASSTYQKLK
jgi:hypothetical protein